MMAAGVSGVLVAGGASARMGRDKATIPLDGTPLWKRQVTLLDAVCSRVTVAAPHRPAWLREGSEFVADDPTAPGPLGGLLAALAWAADSGADHVLALAVDLPAMTRDFLETLARAATPGRGVIYGSDLGYEPLCAVYPVGALPALREAAGAGISKLQVVAGRLVSSGLVAPRQIRTADEPLFYNLNTPDDLARLSRGNS